VQNDLVEAVILLSEKFFYNTTVTGIIIVINKAKPQEKKGKILLINASKLFQNGRLKNFLPDESINLIADIYLWWKEEEGISKIITKEEAACNDYNLSPSLYVAQSSEDNTLPLEDAVVQLQEVEQKRQEVEEKLKVILEELWVWKK